MPCAAVGRRFEPEHERVSEYRSQSSGGRGTADGALNTIPAFITADGPVREARFPYAMGPNNAVTQTPDGGVHDLFTIAGRPDAPECTMAQPNFAMMQQLNNVIFRIPTPDFGAGLIENIADSTIVANMNANTR